MTGPNLPPEVLALLRGPVRTIAHLELLLALRAASPAAHTIERLLSDPHVNSRAGAREQVAQIAASGVGQVAYFSCNPSSWARDGAVLAEAGYRLAELRPIGQFRWSTHVELASLFVKDS